VLDVLAGGTTSIDLTDALQGDPAAIVLNADAPITAGARVTLRNPDIFGDQLYLAAASPMNAPAVVPDNRTTSDLDTRLVLSAPFGAATAVVTGFSGGEEWAAGRVDLGAETTQVLTIEPPKTNGRRAGSYGLVITPSGDAPLYGVRMLDEEGPRGPLVSSFPLTAARLLAEVRDAYPDVAVGTVSQ
jgi:hypothetical protein